MIFLNFFKNRIYLVYNIRYQCIYVCYNVHTGFPLIEIQTLRSGSRGSRQKNIV